LLAKAYTEIKEEFPPWICLRAGDVCDEYVDFILDVTPSISREEKRTAVEADQCLLDPRYSS
jgi:hypothetical protein